jgi:glycosyltransferase involved in cell wall biosynthesis
MVENIYKQTSKKSGSIQGISPRINALKETNNQIQFTGIIVNYNEGDYLQDCLKSLVFCNQLIVFDLGSTDASTDIAKQYGAEIIHHERVPIVEQIRNEAIDYARNDWIVLADPDEVFPANVTDQLRSKIYEDPKLGSIILPLQYYFKNRPLYFTVWGKNRTKKAVLHKNRNSFSSNVHRGIRLLEGYNSADLPSKPEYTIQHYWIDSCHQLIEKHWRYIRREGEARYQAGERFSWDRWMREPLSAFKRNLFDYKGIRGGLLGIFLSGFYSWYIAMSLLSLRRYQKLLKLK